MSYCPLQDSESILLTGVTGGLGSELLPRLVRTYPQHSIVALVRGSDEAAVNARLHAAITFGGLNDAERGRVRAVRGDASAPNFGLSDAAWRGLATKTAQIFHLAANVDFDTSLVESRIANVDSTREILRFARQCLADGRGGFRLNYVSTAYVAGNRRGLLRESELQCGQAFWNAYEQAKMEAEQLVAAARYEIPTTIYRPSQIIGDSRHGRIRKFFGLYEFVKLAQRGKMRILLADPAAHVDMVPSDYVCDAILYLCNRTDTLGHTYHVAAGLGRSINVAQVLDIIFHELAALGKPVRRPKIYPAHNFEQHAGRDEVRQYHSSALKLLLRTYLPYLAYGRDFDVAGTQQRLAAAGIDMAPIDQVVRTTTRYAIQHRFGEQSDIGLQDLAEIEP